MMTPKRALLPAEAREIEEAISRMLGTLDGTFKSGFLQATVIGNFIVLWIEEHFNPEDRLEAATNLYQDILRGLRKH
jgi:hypothetical protein